MKLQLALNGPVLALLLALPAAQAVNLTVAGNTASASVTVGLGTADLNLTFDGVQNLSQANLGISTTVLGPLDLPGVLARLPSSTLTSIPGALPLLITVEPPPGGGLQLQNTVRVELHTHLLNYTAGSPFRLFKASAGGPFVDITDEVAPGSVRTRGTTGGFSQFLVLADLRPTGVVIAQKFDLLRNRLASADASLQSSLGAHLDAAETALANDDFTTAIATIESFREAVSAVAGTGLPNTWSASEHGNNVAGDLLAGAATLRFSIGFQRDFGN